MHVDIIEETSAESPAEFPPSEGYIDLRENPLAIDRISAAREHRPLRNFLASLNGPASIFATSLVSIQSGLPVTSGGAREFGSHCGIVFAIPNLNWERTHYADLCSGLKELLARDASDSARVVLKISQCNFIAERRRGFYLEIELTAQGNSREQAEMRWGLALARFQQALLFRTRALKQQLGA